MFNLFAKLKPIPTVASVMFSFTKTINALEDIADTAQVNLNDLRIERDRILDDMVVVEKEGSTATTIAKKLNNLIDGTTG